MILESTTTAHILIKLTHLKERNIGVFLITHAIGFAERAADQIIFMNDGRIAEIGGPEILAKPKTDRLKQFLSMVRDIS